MKRANTRNHFTVSSIVNWGTVWGLIIAMITLDVYANFQKKKAARDVQLQATARQVDSLRAVKSRLDQQLYTIRMALDQCQTNTLTADSETMAKSE
ncbi:hypothetical protein GCM10023187_13850 [Nibrella viscosa]|uniref:Uncharacterized protein n=1 Tax=Nibrella viscosa TaxID=1084524 RepID=A0ABP8K555_9BACT